MKIIKYIATLPLLPIIVPILIMIKWVEFIDEPLMEMLYKQPIIKLRK